jgi:predicted DNA-binding transcriptional regulator AlpA
MRQHDNAATPTPRFLRARRLAQMLDVSIATIWRWTAAGRLPAPRRLGPNTVAWDIAEVEQALRAGDDNTPRAS